MFDSARKVGFVRLVDTAFCSTEGTPLGQRAPSINGISFEEWTQLAKAADLLTNAGSHFNETTGNVLDRDGAKNLKHVLAELDELDRQQMQLEQKRQLVMDKKYSGLDFAALNDLVRLRRMGTTKAMFEHLDTVTVYATSTVLDLFPEDTHGED